jgi:hypothetical protein
MTVTKSLPLALITSLVLLAVFAQGFLSMGFQLVASRLLAPAFGTTLFVWAFIISTFLAAFSFGALVGGLASRLPAHRIGAAICTIGLIGTGGFIFTAELGHSVIVKLDSMTANMALSLGGSCLVLFLVPTATMSCMLPITIEALTVRGMRGGLSSGVIYAVSTLGNIAGVMTTAFLLIPFFPTSRILVFWSVAAAACFVALYILISRVVFSEKPSASGVDFLD